MLTTGAVREHLEAVEAWDGADFGALDADAALEIATGAARARHALDAVIARSVGRVDELCERSPGALGPARRRGVANASALVAKVTGLEPGEAHRLIDMGRSLLRADAAASHAAGVALSAAAGPVASLEPALPLETAELTDLTPLPDAAASDARFGTGPSMDLGELLESLAPLPGPLPKPALPVPGAALAAAVDSGRLGRGKAEVIRATLADFTIDTIEIEREFIDFALQNSIGMLKKHCFGVLGDRDPEGLAARESRQIRDRFLSVTDGADGMITVFGKFDVGTGAPIKTLIDELTSRGMRAQRDMPEFMRLAPGQIAADALSDIMKHAMSCTKVPKRAKTTVVVRVDKRDLIEDLREAGRLDEEGLTVGLTPRAIGSCDGVAQPITDSMLRMMAVDAKILPAVMGGEPIVLEMGRARRLYSPDQKLAITERDRGCINCSAPPAFCDTHHIEFWSEGGRTDPRNGTLMCTSCHHRLHEQFWRLEVTPHGVRVVENSQWGGAPPPNTHPSRSERPAT